MTRLKILEYSKFISKCSSNATFLLAHCSEKRPQLESPSCSSGGSDRMGEGWEGADKVRVGKCGMREKVIEEIVIHN